MELSITSNISKVINDYYREVKNSKNPLDLLINKSSFYSDLQEYSWFSRLIDEKGYGLLGFNGILHDLPRYTKNEPIKSKLGLNCYKYYKELRKRLIQESGLSIEELENYLIKCKFLQEVSR